MFLSDKSTDAVVMLIKVTPPPCGCLKLLSKRVIGNHFVQFSLSVLCCMGCSRTGVLLTFAAFVAAAIYNHVEKKRSCIYWIYMQTLVNQHASTVHH